MRGAAAQCGVRVITNNYLIQLIYLGTTTTGLLAALTADAEKLAHTLQISLCHLYFNIIGIMLFYPIPFMRWPVPLAKIFGKKVAKHR